MAQKILITYASRTGSTAGVAEAISKVLLQGCVPDVLPMLEVTDLSPYMAVVAGSAIQDRQWLPEAMGFIRANRQTLIHKPFAAFLVCMTLAMRLPGDYRAQIDGWLDPVRQLVKPVSVGLFPGVLDISKILSRSDRLKFRLSVLSGVWTEGDHRDWEAVRDWSESLIPLICG